MRVTVGIPTYEQWKCDFGISLIRALLQDFPYELHLTVRRGCYIADAREQCVEAALEVDSDYLVFVDTDMVFPPDALRRLVEQGKDVIGVNYHEKRLPLVSTVKLPNMKGGFYEGDAALPDQPFKAAAVGTGLMAINLARLREKLTAPFFAVDPNGKPWKSGPGEDIAFAVRASQAGLEVWCDPRIIVHHIGEYPY